MSLLLPPDRWTARRAALRGELGALADGIARELEPVLARPPHVPAEKALLTREGGRCPRDGTLLEFDPFDEGHHRCAACGAVYESDAHRGFWRYWYHLWLAERAVHAAVLHALRGEARHARFAADVLEGYASRYLTYPNRDNALGPSRPFFSTYLESIWLLQLCIALDTLEQVDPPVRHALGARVRERLVEPSARLVASYDEGMSNRQAWNVAARIAAARLLARPADVERAVADGHGLEFLLGNGLLDDGTWYEGENYHMFAHRGLWYGVTMAEAAGAAVPDRLVARFEAGFLAPFLTALPDMTLPSRRDSQYAISLRQPRFAESCELGLARGEEPRLAGVLAALYHDAGTLPHRDNGRACTSADVERNLPAMRLTRADLGWRALLFAREALPPARPALPGSVLLDGQGVAVIRREGGRVYVALDYGHSGGGHGHPDRLNLLLADGTMRWLDDMGTGSYVERTLHWYRSTLAHNAPLVNGHSQRRTDGTLLAWEDRGGAGWVRAAVTGLAPGVRVVRTIVVMPDYLLDELRWEADAEITLDLPLHAPLDAATAEWTAAPLDGGAGLEDGFDFIAWSGRRAAGPREAMRLVPRSDPRHAVRAVVAADGPAEWWRVEAPGAPGAGTHTFHLVRVRGAAGRIRSVWSWSAGAACDVTFEDDVIRVVHDAGLHDVHTPTPDGWHIDLQAGTARSSIDLGGLQPQRRVDRAPVDAPAPAAPRELGPGGELAFTLGMDAYRRSESTWMEAGAPTAWVRLRQEGERLHVDVHVTKRDPMVFVSEGSANLLDNEVPEINGDGIQLYVSAGARTGAWTIVPVPGDTHARAVPVRGWTGLDLRSVTWSGTPDGYLMRASIDLRGLSAADSLIHFGLIVNESAPGRARRRGQLVLGGARGEWVYLRGDRHDRERLLPIRLRAGELY